MGSQFILSPKEKIIPVRLYMHYSSLQSSEILGLTVTALFFILILVFVQLVVERWSVTRVRSKIPPLS